MTVEQFTAKLNDKLSQLEANFFPAEKALQSFKAEAIQRIWADEKNSAEQKLLSVHSYSTKPLWFYDPANLLPISAPGKQRSKKTGKTVKNKTKDTENVGVRNKPIVTKYFAEGYSELKSKIHRPPLELFGELKSDFASAPVQGSGRRYYISLSKENNIEKTEGLVKKYGVFFRPTKTERKKIIAEMSIDVTRYFNGAGVGL